VRKNCLSRINLSLVTRNHQPLTRHHRIKEQKESLAKQIKTANKLTSTVFSLTNDDGEEGESTEHDSGNETTEGDKSSNIVGEFDFLATFEKRVAGMVKKNEVRKPALKR